MNRLSRIVQMTACVGIFAACQTMPHEIPPPVGGKTATGQMQYVGPSRSFIGEFTAAVSPNAFRLVISKGLPLISVQEANGNVARVEAAGRRWQGNPHRAPKQVQMWLALHDVFANELLGPSGVPKKFWTATRRDKVLTVDFLKSGEHLVFHFDK